MPDFVRDNLPKDRVYDLWLSQIERVEQSTISSGPGDDTATDNSLRIGFRLFPIIESVSWNLFQRNGREYLKRLGVSDLEADLIYKMFRNGQMHNTGNYRLVYDDGPISWGMSSSSGSGGISPHYPGYVSEDFPEDNIPADKAFEYVNLGGEYHASLELDRLLAHVKYDLEERKRDGSRGTISFIVGERIEGSRPEPPHGD